MMNISNKKELKYNNNNNKHHKQINAQLDYTTGIKPGLQMPTNHHASRRPITTAATTQTRSQYGHNKRQAMKIIRDYN